jgi:dTDP-4-amino-4,6-dideoxygalactose transaminase
MAQILGALKIAFSSNGNTEECLAALAARLQGRSIFGVSSGRAALWLILKSLHRLRPDRDIVALPAYTCFSVPASIVRARLKLHPLEIDPETLDFDFSRLDSLPREKLLCILSSNLFGLVNDLSRIQEIARTKGAFLVDDAAQALGASRNSQPAGTLGDVGLYSLARGKTLASVGGGIIVTNSEEIARAIQSEVRSLPAASSAHAAWVLLQMLAYAAFLKPRLYWIPNSLPFLKLGVTEFVPNFPTASLSSFTRALLPQLMDRLEEINQVRQKNAIAIANGLSGNPYFTVPRLAPDCQPSYIRFPLIAKDVATRQWAVSHLRAAGIGASPFYPTAICDIAGIEPYMASGDFHRPQAEALSQTLLTLPTHPYVRPQDLSRMIDILNKL